MNELVYSTLVTRLLTVAGIFPLLKENQVLTAKGPFSRATLIRSRPDQLSVGITGRDLHRALLQVDLLVPVNTGTALSNSLADAVIAMFPRGLQLVAGSRILHIITSYRETGNRSTNDQYHITPVVIEVNLVV